MKKVTPLSRIICLLCISLACSNVAFAKSPSFTYLELEYIAAGDFEISDGQLSVAVDMDGFALNASAELGILLLQASRFELESEEILGSNLDDSISTIAIGLTFELPQTAIYGLIAARRDELSLTGGGFDENVDGTSVGVEGGVRVNLTDRFEINAKVGLPDLDEGSSYGVGAQFYITKNFGITFDYSSLEVEDENIRAKFNTSSIGLRYSF